jgi:hypothetical protein
MKNIISILIFTLITNITFGASAPISEIQKKIDNCNYKLNVNIGKSCQGQCLEVLPSFNCEYSEIVDKMIDDETRPIHEAKSIVVACAAVLDDPSTTEIDESKTLEQDCLEKEAAQICDGSQGYFKVRVADNSEVYCTKVVGYEQKVSGEKTITENATKKAAYDSSRLASEQMEAAIASAMKAIDHGKRVIALLLVRNASKGLTTAQIEQMNSTYAEIKNLLETGSLVTAKEKIESITPDGTIVTEADKVALVLEINSFLGL